MSGDAILEFAELPRFRSLQSVYCRRSRDLLPPNIDPMKSSLPMLPKYESTRRGRTSSLFPPRLFFRFFFGPSRILSKSAIGKNARLAVTLSSISFLFDAVEMSNIGSCVFPRGVLACSQPFSTPSGRLYCETDSASDDQNGSAPRLDGDHHRTATALS